MNLISSFAYRTYNQTLLVSGRYSDNIHYESLMRFKKRLGNIFYETIPNSSKHPKFRLKSRLCRVAGYWWSEIVDVYNCDNRRKWQMLHFAYNKNEAVGLPAHRHLKRNQYPATSLKACFSCLSTGRIEAFFVP